MRKRLDLVLNQTSLNSRNKEQVFTRVSYRRLLMYNLILLTSKDRIHQLLSKPLQVILMQQRWELIIVDSLLQSVLKLMYRGRTPWLRQVIMQRKLASSSSSLKHIKK